MKNHIELINADPQLRVKRARERLKRAGINPLAFVKDDGTKSTPETRRKARVDVIDKLFRAGALERMHVDAAVDIESVYNALSRSEVPSGALKEKVDGTTKRSDLLDNLTDREERLLRTSYRGWMQSIIREPPVIHFSDRRIIFPQAMGITVEMIIGNVSSSGVDKGYGLKEGSATKVLRACLDRYCIVAGWKKKAG